uniref:Amino acid transporter n=2 Tax=Schistocephalus solidus TaxID=70667 RepID=A0A0X3NM77_SCHSO
MHGSLCHCLRKHVFIIALFICLCGGIGVGILLKFFNAPEDVKLWLGMPGELFLRALRFCVIPLLSCNIIAVASKVNKRTHGKFAMMAIAYCFIMNMLSSFIGGLLTLAIKPGVWAGNLAPTQPEIATPPPNISSMLMDLLRNMFPDNIVKIFLSSVNTVSTLRGNSSSQSLQDVPGVNIIGLLITSLVIGIAAGAESVQGDDLIVRFFTAAAKVLTRILEKVMWFLPIGVGSLVLRAISNINGADGTARALAMFVVTSFAYLGVITLVLLPTIYLIFVRRDFCKFLGLVIRPMLTAFSTLSSIAALPGVFKVCEQLGMNVQTAQLLGPFLTSFNANGSSAFIASSIIFCAQWAGHTISIGSIIAIFFLTGLNVMALPAVPSASIILVILLVRSFRIPDTAIPFLFVTDFIIDALRTPTNVLSHTTCLLIVDRFEKRRELPTSRSEVSSIGETSPSNDPKTGDNPMVI